MSECELFQLVSSNPFVILAQEGSSGGFNWLYILNPATVWILIPIVAILCGTVTSILKKVQKHQERMAMIHSGMHPDFPPGEEPKEDV